jgi:Regulator of chromosome condensation (RCC1) repeat
MCWGNGANGRLGNGSGLSSLVPLAVPGLATVVGAAAADVSTCALLADGTVKCWNARSRTDVVGVTDAVAISGGSTSGNVCVLTRRGGVMCWGIDASYGGWGSTNYTTAVDVTGLTTGAAEVSAGPFHTCVLMVAGGVKCWGFALFGGGMPSALVPIDIPGT